MTIITFYIFCSRVTSVDVSYKVSVPIKMKISYHVGGMGLTGLQLYFYCVNLQSVCQPVQNAPLYYANNLNHLIKHTHTLSQTHIHTHIYSGTHTNTVSMETGFRAFYDWLFAQDN